MLSPKDSEMKKTLFLSQSGGKADMKINSHNKVVLVSDKSPSGPVWHQGWGNCSPGEGCESQARLRPQASCEAGIGVWYTPLTYFPEFILSISFTG